MLMEYSSVYNSVGLLNSIDSVRLDLVVLFIEKYSVMKKMLIFVRMFMGLLSVVLMVWISEVGVLMLMCMFILVKKIISSVDRVMI